MSSQNRPNFNSNDTNFPVVAIGKQEVRKNMGWAGQELSNWFG